MKILVLYTRLTGYWMSCMQHSRDHFSNEFLVIRSRPSTEAPFQIESEKGIEIINREEMTSEEIKNTVHDFSPSLIYVAGWTNKTYLEIAKKYKKNGVPVVVGMDNHWKGSIKQYLAGILNPFYIKPYFTDIWIPGTPQYRFAKRLGFKDSQIHKGLYCANSNLFAGEVKFQKNTELLFVGRLVNHKGIPQLTSLLKRLIAKNDLSLKIHFVGNGPLADDLPKQKFIKHTTFVSPQDLPALLKKTGFLILPSNYEAWGVVVHEALLSGTPVISTYQCGAALDMVADGKNGFLFDANNFDELEQIFKDIHLLSDEEYREMSEQALQSAQQINLDQWSETLQDIAKH